MYIYILFKILLYLEKLLENSYKVLFQKKKNNNICQYNISKQGKFTFEFININLLLICNYENVSFFQL